MRRSIRPSLESLEGKALLSGVPATAADLGHSSTAFTPPATAADLAYSLTAFTTRTPSGFQVVEKLTETNISNQEVAVEIGPSQDAFTVSQDGKTLWNQYEGQQIPQILSLENLEPHQSTTISATWDDRSNLVNREEPWVEGPPLSGTFTISNELDNGKVTTTVTIPKASTFPVKPTHITPLKPAPAVHIMAILDPPAKAG